MWALMSHMPDSPWMMSSYAARAAYGPSWLKPYAPQYTIVGLSFFTASYPKPSFSIALGRIA
jgi:hypothetical protein